MRHKRRIPRFILVTAGLFLALEAITGAMLGLVRATHRHYVCLSFDPGRVIDVNSGLDLVDRRPPVIKSTMPPGYISPDGKYSVIVEETEAGRGRLVTFPLSGHGMSVTLEDDIDPTIDIDQMSWAPVSPANTTRIAYAWTAKDGYTSLTVADLGERGLLNKKIRPLKAPFKFSNWSPDGTYFAFVAYYEGRLKLWSMADQREMDFPLSGGILGQLTWASNSSQFAYVHHDLNSFWLTIATPGGDTHTFNLPNQISGARLSWSPGGRYVAVSYVVNWPRWRIGVFGIDGSTFDVAEVDWSLDLPFNTPADWSVDGQTVLYMQDRQNHVWDWMAFYPNQNRSETLVADLITPPAFAPGQDRRMTLSWRSQTGQHNVAVMDSDGTHRTMLAENADNAGSPFWSPDGQFVAVTWATGQQANRVVRLSITRQDGSGMLILDDQFWDVRDLRWPSDGKSLAFVAWRSDAQGKPVFSAEVINLETGQLRRLAGGLVQISMFAIDPRSGGITFWWRMADGQIGADAYKSDGTRLYRFRADASTGASINGQLSQGEYWTAIQPGSPQVFPAPDGSIAALKLGPPGNESLQLASSDGARTRLIRSGLSGLGDPLWSPDGRILAFTQSVNHNPITLSVIRADGSPVQDIDRFSGGYARLTWTKCD